MVMLSSAIVILSLVMFGPTMITRVILGPTVTVIYISSSLILFVRVIIGLIQSIK